MKLTAQRAAFLKAVQAAGAAVAGRSTRPVLAQLLVEAVGADALAVTGTDTEAAVRYEVRGVRVDRPGAAMLPPDKLAAILRESASEDVTLTATDGETRVVLSDARYTLEGADPAEFPGVAEDGGDHTLDIEYGVLADLIGKTSFAAEKKESTRWAITGLLWEPRKDGVRIVATDTKRLAVADGPAALAEGVEPGASYLLPAAAVGHLSRAGLPAGEAVRVTLRANEARFRAGPMTLTTKLVEGQFPPYSQILPKSHAARAEFAAGPFLRAVRAAAVTASADSRRVDCRFGDGKAVLSATGGGASEIEALLASYDGPPVDIAFDPAYLTDLLKAAGDADAVVLEMTGGEKPAVFRVGEGWTCLVMPLAG